MSKRCALVCAAVACLVCATCLVNAEHITVTGSVIARDGAPVGDCEVIVRCRTYQSEWAWPTARVHTDGGGRFSCTLDPGHPGRAVQAAAVKKGFAVGWAVAPAPGDLVVRLGSGPVACAGIITDADGNPIPNARAAICDVIRPAEEMRFWQHLHLGDRAFLSSTTDETGAFEIGDLPPGAWIGLLAEAEGRERLVIEPEVSAGRRDVRLVLQPEATISGRIAHNGQPAAGIAAVARSESRVDRWAKTISREDGTYKLTNLRFGTYTVMIQPTDQLTAAPSDVLTVAPGEQVTGVDFDLSPGSLVQGKVTEVDTGGPLAGAPITAKSLTRPGFADLFRVVTTDESGTYTARLPAGQGQVSYYVHDFPYWTVDTWQHQVEIVEGQTVTDLDFVLKPRPRLPGRVIGLDGRGVAGAQVAPVSEFYIGHLEDYLRTQTDSEGRFDLPLSRDPRDEIVLAVFGRHLVQDLAGIAFVEEPYYPVQLRLSKGAYVVTEVTDADGNPLPNTPVMLSMAYEGTNGAKFLTAYSDEKGIARFGPLAPGLPVKVQRWSHTASRALDPVSLWKDLGPIRLSPGQEYKLPPLQLNVEGRTLEGWVVDADLLPVAGALVAATGSRELAFSDERGHFELGRLPTKGKVWLTAAHPAERLFAAQQVDPGWEIEPSLVVQPLCSAKGRILGPDGKPVAQARVSLHQEASPVRSAELRKRVRDQAGLVGSEAVMAESGRATRADDEGRWRLQGLVAGAEYVFMVGRSESGYAFGLAEVTAEPGETMDLGDLVMPSLER